MGNVHRQDPKMNKDRVSCGTRYGYCRECGKECTLRNSDGKIRDHVNPTFGGRCKGSFTTPGQAARSVFKKNWEAPRRTE